MKGALWICSLFMTAPLCMSQVDYSTQVQPVFNASCLGCHGNTSGVSLNSYAKVMASVGSQFGTAAVQPGSKESSPLWIKINPNPPIGVRMPPNNPLDQTKIDIIGQWIDEGASESATAVEDLSGQPFRFALIDNYPNPFNPATTIRFSLPDEAFVTFQVCDIRGAVVNLYSGYFQSGEQVLTIRLGDRPSGLYTVRMQALAGNKTFRSRAMKILLLK
ncbi:T9SS type A sorting domain-containing protein [bacterium]|nr:T9SS type A sorting domain-containing protein [bacterium]